jgi:hypothetical protein
MLRFIRKYKKAALSTKMANAIMETPKITNINGPPLENTENNVCLLQVSGCSKRLTINWRGITNPAEQFVYGFNKKTVEPVACPLCGAENFTIRLWLRDNVPVSIRNSCHPHKRIHSSPVTSAGYGTGLDLRKRATG